MALFFLCSFVFWMFLFEALWASILQNFLYANNKQSWNLFGVLSMQVLTSGGLLGHTASSIEGQDGVLGQGLLGHVIAFSAAATVTEQVQLCLAWPWGGTPSCWSLCWGAGSVTGAHLDMGKGDRERNLCFQDLLTEEKNQSWSNTGFKTSHSVQAETRAKAHAQTHLFAINRKCTVEMAPCGILTGMWYHLFISKEKRNYCYICL